MLHVEHVAELLHTTPKAVRSRVSAGQLPKPWKDGKRLAWTRETVRAWLSDRSRAAEAKPPVQIVISNYSYKNTQGLQAIFKMQFQGQEVKTTSLVPEGIKDRDQAKVWAAEQVEHVLPKLLAKAGIASSSAPEVPTRKEEPPQTQTITSMTFKDFVDDRFIPEYVQQWKASSQDIYYRAFRDFLFPAFGQLPLAAVDENHISRFRGRIMKYTPGFKNMLLAKLRKLLEFAVEVKEIQKTPVIKRFADPRKEIVTYSMEELAAFIAAGERESPQAHIASMLSADLGLRCGEIRGLRWSDVDLRNGEIKVCHNASKGSGGTPKGTIATLAMPAALRRALEEHRKREPIGPLVLYLFDQRLKRWKAFSQNTMYRLLCRVGKAAGLKDKGGSRYLRHCAITNVATLGATPVEVQSHARHAHMATTEIYLHPHRAEASHSAMERLDAARGEEVPLETKTRSKITEKPPS